MCNHIYSDWGHMKFLNIFVFFILLFPLCSVPQQDEEPIIVRLDTETPLLPLFLAPITNDRSDFSDTYLKQLEQILAFDLNHNGATTLVKQNSGLIALIPESVDQLGSIAEWKARQIFYVIRVVSQGKTIKAFMLSVNNQTIKATDFVTLSGDFSKDRTQIHKLADTIYKALFSKDGISSTKILYTVKTSAKDKQKQWSSEIWEMDYDGANGRCLAKNSGYCVSPVYLPAKPGFSSGGFLYVSYQLGQPKIYVASLKEGVGKRLTFLRGNQLMPAISSKRDKVAFISDVTGNPDLFLLMFSPETGALGKPQQIFSAKKATQASPTFSPDGNQIAFVSDKDGSPKIYVIDIPQAGTSLKDINAKLISKRNRENSAPAWSADGTKIAYCARNLGSDRQIWVYDFLTNQERQVTEGKGNKENPSWAPDSLHLVFNASDDQLYMLNLNQAEATQITSGPGEKRFPSWEPRY